MMFDLAPDQNQEKDILLSSGCCKGMLYGAISFAVVSVIAYSVWAFRLVPDRNLSYGVTIVIYVVLSGFALSQQVVKPNRVFRFCVFFGLIFMLYAGIWMLFWRMFGEKLHGDFYGFFIGLLLMALFFKLAFGSNKPLLPLFSVLFTCHMLGYFIGWELHSYIPGSLGRILWGLGHGLGFGAGLGHLMYQCQLRE